MPPKNNPKKKKKCSPLRDSIIWDPFKLKLQVPNPNLKL